MSGSARKLRTGHLGLTLGFLTAVTAVLGAASSAEAGSRRDRDPRVQFSISIGHRGASYGHSHSHCSYDSIEYDRGLCEGEDEGFEAGRRDGRAGRHYCPEPTHIHHGSRAFERGFEAGWMRGYARGFEQGRCERPVRRHVHGHFHRH